MTDGNYTYCEHFIMYTIAESLWYTWNQHDIDYNSIKKWNFMVKKIFGHVLELSISEIIKKSNMFYCQKLDSHTVNLHKYFNFLTSHSMFHLTSSLVLSILSSFSLLKLICWKLFMQFSFDYFVFVKIM